MTSRFNPYSNGSSFFIFVYLQNTQSHQYVSILILMDLPFLFFIQTFQLLIIPVSILILMDLPFLSSVKKLVEYEEECFNPYSNGSSFFIQIV